MPRSLTPEDDKPADPHAPLFTFTVFKWGATGDPALSIGWGLPGSVAECPGMNPPMRKLARLHQLVNTARRWGMTSSRIRCDKTGLEFSWRNV